MIKPDKISVCLVDDEKDVIESFSSSLQDHFEMRSFLSPSQALSAFDNGYSPSIVVSDLQMPEMNGLKFIEKLKQHGLSSKVVVSSGYADKNVAVSALNLGVDGFLEKPFTMRDFKEMLNHLANLNSEPRALVDNLCKLNELYFKRVVLAENFIFEKGLNYPEEKEEKMDLLEGMKDERLLLVEIKQQMKRLFNADF